MVIKFTSNESRYNSTCIKVIWIVVDKAVIPVENIKIFRMVIPVSLSSFLSNKNRKERREMKIFFKYMDDR